MERFRDAPHDRAGHPFVGHLKGQVGDGENAHGPVLVIDDQDPVNAFLFRLVQGLRGLRGGQR